MAMNVALIGCGLIGKKRAAQVAKDPAARLTWAVDVDPRNEMAGSSFSTDWTRVVNRPEIDVVIVSTPNHLAVKVAIESLKNGKHVLIEKPLGRDVSEAKAVVLEAKKAGKILKTGFNHRFHPGIYQAKDLVDAGKIGDLISIRGRYGHGSRPGMEKEWRSSKELCGGGELLDQGVHLIDLIQWFGGDIAQVYGMAETQFWKIDVEDNAYVLAKTKRNVNALFHVSWTNWRNVFSFELFGTKGYATINGLGGHYGVETLEVGIRKEEGGRPDIQTFEYPGEDLSWEWEWAEFKQAILNQREPIGSGTDGWKANLAIEAVLRSHQEKRLVDVESAVFG
ncbi:MAG: Gfo/Idh/MocA family oxidoreductase [Verrucomicrobia bacterium]|nr:Gfo/Idh/MocA family oxidoreductase [Verrucomicrobiota bacterium]